MSAHTAAQLLLSAAKYRFGRKFKEAKTTKNLKELNLTLLKELTQYYNHTSICGNTGIPPSFTEYGYIIATYCMAFNWPLFFCTIEARRW